MSAEQLNLNDLTFRIRRSRLDRVQLIARESGIEIEIGELDPLTVAYELYYNAYGDDNVSRRQVQPFMRHAQALCADYCMIVAHAPVSEWSVVALAEVEECRPVFFSIDPSAGYWTTANMDNVDFQRCDECGVKHNRGKVFIIRKGETFKQVGGACAKHLDLTKKLRDLVKGFKSFIKRLNDDFEDDMFIRSSNTMNVQMALLIADESIRFEGYVSSKKADEHCCASTAQSVRMMLEDKKAQQCNVYRRAFERFQAGDGEAMFTACLEWVNSQPDAEFTRNCRTALLTGSNRLMGFSCFIPEGIRRDQAKQATAEPHPYEHVNGRSIEEVARQCDVGMNELCDAIGIEPAKVSAKGTRKTIDRILPGCWRVIKKTGWESMYGYTEMMIMDRQDGSRVKWVGTSLPSDIGTGDMVLILSATVGEKLADDFRYGVQGTKINRANVIKHPSKK